VYCLLPHWLVMVADHCDVSLFALLLHQGAVPDFCECNYVCLLVTTIKKGKGSPLSIT